MGVKWQRQVGQVLKDTLLLRRVGRTARLGQKGEAMLFLQPSESDYMQELKKHGVSLKELPLPQLLDGLQARRGKRDDSFAAVDMHPLATLMQNALEAFVAGKVGFEPGHLYSVQSLGFLNKIKCSNPQRTEGLFTMTP